MAGALKPPLDARHRAPEMGAGRRHRPNALCGGCNEQATLREKYLPPLWKLLGLADFKHGRRPKGEVGNEKSKRADTQKRSWDTGAAPRQPSQKFLPC